MSMIRPMRGHRFAAIHESAHTVRERRWCSFRYNLPFWLARYALVTADCLDRGPQPLSRHVLVSRAEQSVIAVSSRRTSGGVSLRILYSYASSPSAAKACSSLAS